MTAQTRSMTQRRNFQTQIVLLWTTLLLGVCGMLWCGPLHADTSVTVRRFALIVGANDGGKERVGLRYAQSDAVAFEQVLREIGGVQQADRLLILKSDSDSLLRGFSEMRRRLQNAANPQTRLELIFYYSGHSDERGLLLGESVFEFSMLKKQLDALPALVRIGILDSCASGALVRLKGGRRTAPFLLDASTEVRGYALLTSSSADENAQESERIGASYFTHYLISGMRGAADSNRDGRVTLNESYAYAFDETLQRTVSSQGGAQHPNYDFQLAGAGDLVLTDLRGTDAVLAIPVSVEGRIYVRETSGKLVAEINKSTPREVRIALPMGKYEVVVESADHLRKGYIHLKNGDTTELSLAELLTVQRFTTASRGGENSDTIIRRTAAATVTKRLSTNPKGKVENRWAANVIGTGYSLRGAEVGILLNRREFSVHGVQAAIGVNKTRHLSGMQFGAMNMAAGDVKGAQVAYINTAGTFERGIQLGLFNATEEKSNAVQVGLINYMPDGLFSVGAFASDTSLFNIAVRMGGRHTFSTFTAGTRAYSENNWVSLGYGFGGHFEPARLPVWMETDFTIDWLCDDVHTLNAVDFLAKARLTFGVRILGALSVYAGPLINTLLSEKRETVAVLPSLQAGEVNGYHYEVSPGFYAGFQLEPRMGRFNRWKGNLEE